MFNFHLPFPYFNCINSDPSSGFMTITSGIPTVFLFSFTPNESNQL